MSALIVLQAQSLLNDAHNKQMQTDPANAGPLIWALCAVVIGVGTKKLNKECSVIVESLAKEFFAYTNRISGGWEKAFFRFHIASGALGSNGSYQTSTSVSLFDPFEDESFFDTMNLECERLHKLLTELGTSFVVCLLTIDASGDYKILFEQEDPSKWKITKVDGGSGLPNLD